MILNVNLKRAINSYTLTTLCINPLYCFMYLNFVVLKNLITHVMRIHFKGERGKAGKQGIPGLKGYQVKYFPGPYTAFSQSLSVISLR